MGVPCSCTHSNYRRSVTDAISHVLSIHRVEIAENSVENVASHAWPGRLVVRAILISSQLDESETSE